MDNNVTISNTSLLCNIISLILLIGIFIFPTIDVLFYFLLLFATLPIAMGIIALIKENNKIQSIVSIALGIIFLLILSYLKNWDFIIRNLSRGG